MKSLNDKIDIEDSDILIQCNTTYYVYYEPGPIGLLRTDFDLQHNIIAATPFEFSTSYIDQKYFR